MQMKDAYWTIFHLFSRTKLFLVYTTGIVFIVSQYQNQQDVYFYLSLKEVTYCKSKNYGFLQILVSKANSLSANINTAEKIVWKFGDKNLFSFAFNGRIWFISGYVSELYLVVTISTYNLNSDKSILYISNKHNKLIFFLSIIFFNKSKFHVTIK